MDTMKENMEAFVRDLRTFLSSEHVLADEPMRLHTTFEIGGPADVLVLPGSMDEVAHVLRLVKAHDVPVTLLGNGSNVLVLDGGIRGAVVKFNHPMSDIRVDGTRIVAGAGALLKDVSAVAASHGLTGMEFACGIPGSLGGAARAAEVHLQAREMPAFAEGGIDIVSSGDLVQSAEAAAV